MQSTGGSAGRSMFAGALGGIIAVGLLAGLGALLMRRMMKTGCCAESMRACMAKCGCGGPDSAKEADPS